MTKKQVIDALIKEIKDAEFYHKKALKDDDAETIYYYCGLLDGLKYALYAINSTDPKVFF